MRYYQGRKVYLRSVSAVSNCAGVSDSDRRSRQSALDSPGSGCRGVQAGAENTAATFRLALEGSRGSATLDKCPPNHERFVIFIVLYGLSIPLRIVPLEDDVCSRADDAADTE